MYAGVAIAVLLLASTTQGAWFAAVALALLGLGLVLFPDRRRFAVPAAAMAAATAAVAVLLSRMFR